MNPVISRYEIVVTGLVQGIGFRPFVYNLAKRFNMKGTIYNNSSGVSISAEGTVENLKSFYKAIPLEIPENGKIETIRFEEKEPVYYKDFSILESREENLNTVYIPPDYSICDACKSEILDPMNRRYYYPFTTCVSCGPRFTVIEKFPYDRVHTVMNSFPQCKSCEEEYRNPKDRRFHAELIACEACGPKLAVYDSNTETGLVFNNNREIFSYITGNLKSGKIVAIKSIGGFHLACEADRADALALLRLRKKRKTKPFAVMFPDLNSILEVAFVNKKEKDLLTSKGSPIVLLRKKNYKSFPFELDENSPFIGAFLPYTPLHVLLFSNYKKPLVMTSANSSEEPVLIHNEDAINSLRTIADIIVLHDRKILLSCDDSVMKVTNGEPEFIRRGRGYSPYLIQSKKPFRECLSMGADMKNTISISSGNNLITSGHIGNLGSPASLESYSNTINHFAGLYKLNPDTIIIDKHPGYYSSKKSGELFIDNSILSIQHHHSHIASVMAENGIEERVLGIALDGTGYEDGEIIRGGEFLIADRSKYSRVGNLLPFCLIGGEIAIRETWRLGLSLLLEAEVSIDKILELNFIQNNKNIKTFQTVWERKINSPLVTGCGRLFDAVSAITGICTFSEYDGEAAVKLENLIYKEELDRLNISDYYKIELIDSQGLLLDWRKMVLEILEDIHSGVSRGLISLKFHLGLVHAIGEAAILLSEKYKVDTIALGGGCFHNSFLKEKLIHFLEGKNKHVIYNRNLPSGDGSISFGQLIVANSILAGEKSCVWPYQ